ncbi:MAG TPA: recombinase family protein [Patescibacteria group bacterium]
MSETTGHIRAVIYTRVSTQEQAKEDKTSLEEQLAACKKMCIERGWEVVSEYQDAGISGHLLVERLGLQNLLADAKAGKFDLVVVKDFDRLARSKTYASQIRDGLKKQFVQTYSLATPVEPRDPKKYDPMDDDLGLVVEGVSDFMSEIERNKIRRRMTLAKNAIAMNGKLPNRVPFGYKVVRSLDPHGKVLRAIGVDEAQAEVVRRIFQMSEAGMGKRTIALTFNQEGVSPIKTGSDSYWRSQAISYILRNKTYAGYVRWGWRHADYEVSRQKKLRGHEGIEVKGQHPAIISEELFDKVQLELKKRGTSHKGKAQMSRGLLTGIAKCIRCGNGVTYCKRRIKNSKRNPNWNDIETAEYRCGGTMYGRVKCSQRVMSAVKLEYTVISQLRNYFNSPAMKKMIQEETTKPLEVKTKKSPLSKIEEELNKIPAMKQKQQEAYERGFVTIEEYGEIIGRLRKRENELYTDKARYSQNDKSKNINKTDKQKLWKAVKDFDGFWESLDFLGKKQFLKTVLEKVEAGNSQVNVYFSE